MKNISIRRQCWFEVFDKNKYTYTYTPDPLLQLPERSNFYFECYITFSKHVSSGDGIILRKISPYHVRSGIYFNRTEQYYLLGINHS